MERKKFLKGSMQSLMGASMLPFMIANNASKGTKHDFVEERDMLSSNSSDAMFNVYDYGAQGDGKQMDTKALQQAIDACYKAGGGKVLLPKGMFLTGTIFLKSHVFLKLAAGATILGSTYISDFNSKHPHLIYAYEVQHAGVIGEGTINGQGDSYWRGKERPFHRPDYYIRYQTSKDMKLEGINIENSPGWVCDFINCDRVRVEGVTIINDHDAPNTDGIDPSSSSDVFISNCYIDTGDDAICLKAGSSRPTENIVVTNCTIRSDDSAIKCGTSSHGSIRHCVFSNIVIKDSKYGITFFVKDGDSTYEDIQFSNINIGTKRLSQDELKSGDTHYLQKYYPIFMDIEPRTPQSGLGAIRNISFTNISIDTWSGNCLIQGRENKVIESISLDNIQMRVHSRSDYTDRTKPRGTRSLKEKAPNDFSDVPSHFTFGNIKGLRVNNLCIEDRSNTQKYARHAFWGTNMDEVTLAQISYKPVSADKDTPTVNFQNSKNMLLKDNLAPTSNISFVQIEGKSSQNINIIGNDFSRAKQGISKNKVGQGVVFESANRPSNTSG